MRPYSTQKIKSHYILDFYFPQSKLAIEVDGKGHNNKKQRAYDIRRSKILKKMGIKVVRFTNKEVLDDVIAVSDRVYGIAIARERERKPKRSKRRAAR